MDLVIKREQESLGDSKTILFENLQAECNNDQTFEEIQLGQDKSNPENKNRDLDQDGSYQCDNCPELFEAIELYEIHRYIHNPGGSCPHCKRSYKNAKPFHDHIKGHIRNHIKCNYCPKIFFMKKTYICHVAQHKKVDRIFSCNYCEKKFSTSKQLINHTRVHTNERPYQCGQCDKSFKQNGSLKTHMNTHMEEKMYTCDLCQGTFATTSSLRRHEKRIHATGRSMVCKLCEEQFLNLDSFYQHRMEKHPDFKRYFRICSICSEEFLSRHVYLGHRKMHINNGELEESNVVAEAIDEDSQEKKTKMSGEKMQKCVLCGMLLVFNDYYTHQNVHLEMTNEEVMECEKKFKFKCKKCDAVLSTKHRAFKHMDVHLEKMYFCSIKDCIRKKPMTYMTYTKHRNYNHKNVKCRNCNATFPNFSAFKRHRSTNPCKIKAVRKKTYMCKFCKSTFANQQFMFLHYKTHRRINAYNCHTCNKKFPRFVNFRKHMFVVHSEQIDASNTSPYRLESDVSNNKSSQEKFYCPLCKEAFQSKQTYSEHETMHFKSKFQCKKCKKLFVRQTNYSYHVENELCANWLAEAMLDEITDFRCRTCKKELSNLRNLARHMTNVHGSREYRCKHCVAQFNSVEKFRSHLVMRHPNEKKYFCTLCDKVGFVTFKEFIDHRREHKRRRHVKQVVCKVTMEDLEQCNKRIDVKEEMVSEEESEIFDEPEIVTVSENGDIQESV